MFGEGYLQIIPHFWIHQQKHVLANVPKETIKISRQMFSIAGD